MDIGKTINTIANFSAKAVIAIAKAPFKLAALLAGATVNLAKLCVTIAIAPVKLGLEWLKGIYGVGWQETTKAVGAVANNVYQKPWNRAVALVKNNPVKSGVGLAVAAVSAVGIGMWRNSSVAAKQQAEANDLQQQIAEIRTARMQNFSGPETPKETHFQNMVKSGQQSAAQGQPLP